jgi:hypothetical protein
VGAGQIPEGLLARSAGRDGVPKFRGVLPGLRRAPFLAGEAHDLTQFGFRRWMKRKSGA